MSLICPIVPGSGVPAAHVYVHLGLTAIILVAGAILLVRGILAFRRSAPPADKPGHPRDVSVVRPLGHLAGGRWVPVVADQSRTRHRRRSPEFNERG
jgi:hypothetical protein